MPTTATPCVPQRWRAAWKNWGSPDLSRPRVSNDNPFSESPFRTAKYRPDYPSRPFASKEEACQWVSSFVDWYNHRHRHSGIKFVTPQQPHSGQAVEICRHRAVAYEHARLRHSRRWTRSTRCWRQPEVVWINPPPPEIEHTLAMLMLAFLAATQALLFRQLPANAGTAFETQSRYYSNQHIVALLLIK